MSAQAGVWNFDGRPADRDLLDKLNEGISQGGSDGQKVVFDGSVGMLYRAFHTTLESHLECQPYTSSRGCVITWDGRLDNRDDLISELHNDLAFDQTDVAIVAAAFDKWGTDCFSKLVGDWALTVWDPCVKSLVLARDCSAIRHLYYCMTDEKILWCTQLKPLVIFSGHQFALNDEYIAGYLVANPEAHLTPYQEILAVPPGKFLRLHNAKATIYSYWRFEPKKSIRYKTDAECEEQYRHLFRQAVRRRLRSDAPVLGELSGGFDSSAIVCMADEILLHEGAQTPRVDTLSYYDLSEPQGDDFSYFTKVEKKRGRSGFHLDTAALGPPVCLEYSDFTPTPFPLNGEAGILARNKIIHEGGYRVSLCGNGGDEMNGQAAEFRVQMGDLIMELRFLELARQLRAWSFLMKRPWMQLFFQSLIQLFPTALRAKMTKAAQLYPWIDSKFAKRHHLSRRQLGEVEGAQFWFPSLRDWAFTLASLTNQMASQRPSMEEKRYPYLDRDLVEFLISIPQNQLLRPGERRSLMRRALRGFLPPEVLLRQTKAASSRCFILMMENQWLKVDAVLDPPLTGRLGYINSSGLRDALRAMKNGDVSIFSVCLLRALSLELWLRDVTERGLIAPYTVKGPTDENGSRSITRLDHLATRQISGSKASEVLQTR